MKSKHSVKNSVTNSAHYLIWQVNNGWQQQLRGCLKPYELTYVEFILLAIMIKDMHRGAATQEHLIMHSRTDKNMTSKVLRSLEAKRLICRRKGLLDGRAVSLRVTTKGFNLYNEAAKAVMLWERTQLQKVSKRPSSVVNNLRKLAGDTKNR